MPTITLDHLRHYAVARSLFAPTTLGRAIQKLGFVQADPIRAPARAQDLSLRHRVKNYRAGDLERRYAQLPIEEDFFINYGYLPRATQQLMHPRTARTTWSAARWAQAQAVLDFVRERGAVHPRDVDLHFAHGKVRNWFGGSTNASTQLLDGMHYRGLVRIARRDSGVRVYAANVTKAIHAASADSSDQTPGLRSALSPEQAQVALDTLIDVVFGHYAPMPLRSLSDLISRLCWGGAPQWMPLRRAALVRACARLPQAQVNGDTWLWVPGENPAAKRHAPDETLRLLAPFDPVVWDRRRFEAFWGWAYRFEAYTPAAQRVRGYYALPLLWRGQVIGWGNLAVRAGQLEAELGYVNGKAPRDAAFKKALADELAAMRQFLGCD